MATTETKTILVQLSANCPSMEICEVLNDSEKSMKLRNVDNGAVCFVPKSGLKLRKPGVPTYENEYVLVDWFRCKLNGFQVFFHIFKSDQIKRGAGPGAMAWTAVFVNDRSNVFGERKMQIVVRRILIY